MSSLRSGSPGATRVCPHCKATVLETSAVCPGCRHHLRFNPDASQGAPEEGYSALNVDGTISHKAANEPCEYFVVLDIRNARGEQLTRQVVGVGVLQAGEVRRLNVSVGMRPVRAAAAVKPQAPAASAPTATSQPAAARARPAQASPAVVESRLQPQRPTGKSSGPGTTGGSSPRFRNFQKPS
jgi:hypothetical protein